MMHVFIVKNPFNRTLSVKKDLDSAKESAISDFKLFSNNADFSLEQKIEKNIRTLIFNYRCKLKLRAKLTYEIEEHNVE